MNPRTSAILMVVAAALGAFVYFYEIRGGEVRQEAEEQEKRLFAGVEAADVDWIGFVSQEGRPVRMERVADGWQITEPLRFPADEFTADGMASALEGLARQARLESPQAAAIYGLDADARVVRFGAGDREGTLRMGDPAPVGSASYVSVDGREAIYTVSTISLNAFQKSLLDVRRKQILSFDSDAVTRIETRWPGGGVVLQRQEEGWQLTLPLEGPADPRTVDDLLSDLRYLRADSFVDEVPSDAEAGLDPPDFVAQLSLAPGPEEGGAGEAAAGPARLSVEIGRPTGDDARLVRAGEPSLYRIRSDQLSQFPTRVVEYRFRQLAEFQTSEARRVTLEFREPGDDAEPLRIQARREDGRWSSEPEPMGSEKLSNLVYELSRLRARDILAESAGPDELRQLGLDPPRVSLRVFGGADEDAEEAEPLLADVHLGVLRDGAGIVARAPAGLPIYELEGSLAETLPVSLEAFRNRFVQAEPAAGDAATFDPSELDLPSDPELDPDLDELEFLPEEP